MATTKEVVDALSNYQNQLTYTETQTHTIIKSRQFLGVDIFAKVAAIVRNLGGEYISAGKESHFRVPLTTGNPEPTPLVCPHCGKEIAIQIMKR